MQAVAEAPIGGAMDTFDTATALLYIDATAGLALAHDVESPDDTLHVLLKTDDSGWRLAAGALTAYDFPEWLDVSPQQRAFTAWGRLKAIR